MTQSWRKIKIDVNDTLYSKIIRYGQLRCWKCGLYRDLQCCHITTRSDYATRFMLEPIRAAVPLCSNCHAWLDSNKLKAVVLCPEKRVFRANEEGYSFLVECCGYTWYKLETLFVLRRQTGTYRRPFQKKAMTIYLRAKLKELEK